jgi:hypothetical protein
MHVFVNRGAVQMNNVFKVPKTLLNHPAILEVESGYEGGAPDYKYDIRLKDGYVFQMGRMQGCSCGLFNTVNDFLTANPIKKE